MHIKPKKRLGQNFLIDKNIQRRIIDCLELKPSDIFLEIGSGRGELTALLARKTEKIYALEIDARLCEALRANLKGYSNVEIINQDILKFNLRKHFSATKTRIKVAGNIPYYISSPIIEHLIKFRDKIEVIFITVQKEFARRMIASPGPKDYSAFSCYVQYYLQPEILLNIKKASFFPAPKVDSCLVRLKIRERPLVSAQDEKLLFKIIRAAFNKRRKTLRNSLTGIISGKKLDSFFHKYGIDRNTRPERLSLQDFANLANA
jgi:16S rRNA (adenine1518-N6/adenine1519-N6)-dimethyltransferase